MAADILNLADAIVADLNGHSFSQPFTAERGYLPTFELPELGDLKVTVVPTPSDATVTIDGKGKRKGLTSLAGRRGKAITVEVSKPGFETKRESIRFGESPSSIQIKLNRK